MPGPADPSRDRLGVALLVAGLGLLLLVGLLRPSVASPPLGPDGWAPPALPWRPSGWLVTGLQTLGYVLGAAALLRQLRRPSPLRLRWWHLAGLAGLVLLTAPFGTADHTNYAAYGRILVEGGDPWSVVPSAWRDGADPVVSLVQPPWQDTPNVYGPVATALLGVAAWVGGESMRQVVWVWQVVVVAAWLGTRALLIRLGADGETVDRWWTTNVLVLGAGVLGAHVDLVAVAPLALALLLGVRGRPLLAGLAVGVALSVKITAGVVGVALVLAWVLAARAKGESLGGSVRAALPRLARLTGGALLVAVPAHLAAGPHVFTQLREQTGGVSYAMPWRAVYTLADLALPEPVARAVATNAAAVGCVLLALLLWRLTDGLLPDDVPGLALRLLLVLTAAYALGAAYVLPWYELPLWLAVTVTVGQVAARRQQVPPDVLRVARVLLGVLVLRALVLALAYVPGRVRLPEDLETVTLGFRMVASPVATVAVWVVLVVLWRQRRHRATGPDRPRATVQA